MMEQHHEDANPFTRLILEIFRVNGGLIEAGDRLCAPVDLSSARWQVLGVVEHGPAPVAHVARSMGLARQSVQQTADALKRNGLIEYRQNPHHRRAKLMCMTPAGREALDYVQDRLAEWSTEIQSELDLDSLETALALLRQVGDILDDDKEERAETCQSS